MLLMSSATAFLLRRRCLFLYGCGCRRSFATENHQKTPQLPWLMLSSRRYPRWRYCYEPSNENPEDKEMRFKFKCKFHLPLSRRQCFIGSSHGFLITAGFNGWPNSRVFNPVTGTILPFPTVNISAMAGCISHKPMRFFSWNVQCNEPLTHEARYLCVLHSKAVLSPCLKSMLLLRRNQLFISRLGGNNDKISAAFRLMNIRNTQLVDNAIFHQGRVHSIDIHGRLTIYDGDDPTSNMPFFVSSDSPLDLERDPLALEEEEYKDVPGYLVESPDGKQLFFVYRRFDPCSKRTVWFDVFKLNKKKKYRWDEKLNIGDLAMFVGPNTAFSVNARDFPGKLKPNSIYFSDNFTTGLYIQPKNVGDTGVFSLSDSEIQFYNLKDGPLKFSWPPPIWFTPTMH